MTEPQATAPPVLERKDLAWDHDGSTSWLHPEQVRPASPPESPAERTQGLPRLDRVADTDRREVQARTLLLGELHDLHPDLPPDRKVLVYDIYVAASRWSGWGGGRTADRNDVAMSAAELAELGRTAMTPAHVRVVEEALRLAELVAAVVQPLGYTSQDRVI